MSIQYSNTHQIFNVKQWILGSWPRYGQQHPFIWVWDIGTRVFSSPEELNDMHWFKINSLRVKYSENNQRQLETYDEVWWVI